MAHRCGFYIAQIKTISDRLLEKILEKRGIDAFSGAQGRILDVLWQQDGISVREISNKTGLTMPTLTGMLDRMETQDMVRREPDPTDRRKLKIMLSDQARNLEEEYTQISEDMDGVFGKGFSQEELIQLQEYLERILKNLKEAEG